MVHGGVAAHTPDRLRTALQGFPLKLEHSPGYQSPLVLPPPAMAARSGYASPEGGVMSPRGAGGCRGGGAGRGFVGGLGGCGWGGGEQVQRELTASYTPEAAPEPGESAEEFSQRLVYVAAQALVLAVRGDVAAQRAEARGAGRGAGGGGALARLGTNGPAPRSILQESGDGEMVEVDVEGFVPVDQIGMAPLVKLAPLPPLTAAESRQVRADGPCSLAPLLPHPYTLHPSHKPETPLR